MGDGTDQPSKEFRAADPGEIRVTTLGRVANYVAYANKLITSGTSVITIRGTGRAMSNVVETAEILKYTIKGLHQITTVDTQDKMVDKTEKADSQKDSRKIACFLTVTLSTDPSKIDTSSIGYQAPLSEEALRDVDVERLIHALKSGGIRRRPMNLRPMKKKGGSSPSDQRPIDSSEFQSTEVKLA